MKQLFYLGGLSGFFSSKQTIQAKPVMLTKKGIRSSVIELRIRRQLRLDAEKRKAFASYDPAFNKVPPC